jgi:hypothetical protein
MIIPIILSVAVLIYQIIECVKLIKELKDCGTDF